jgi:hypothetical protein
MDLADFAKTKYVQIEQFAKSLPKECRRKLITGQEWETQLNEFYAGPQTESRGYGFDPGTDPHEARRLEVGSCFVAADGSSIRIRSVYVDIDGPETYVVYDVTDPKTGRIDTKENRADFIVDNLV